MNKRYQELVKRCVSFRVAPCRLQEYADRIKDTYCVYRRRTTPGYYASKKHEMAWLEAAALCVELSAQPEQWVEAQFGAGGYIPYPNNIHGEHAVRCYNNWMAIPDCTDIRIQLMSYADILKTFKQTMPVREVLTDSKHGFPAVFIYCMARVAGMTSLAEEYEESAKHDLSNPAYRKVYSEYFNAVIADL